MDVSSLLSAFSPRPCELQRPSLQAVQNAEMASRSPVWKVRPLRLFHFVSRRTPRTQWAFN